MAAAYLLKKIPQRFMGTTLDAVGLAEQLGDLELITMLVEQPVKNTSLLPYWRDVSDSWAPLSKTSTKLPDISLWESGCLLLNDKAYEVLSEPLKGDGEFLPVTVDGQRMRVFNCLAFGKEDLSLTERQYIDGYENGISSLAFDEEDIKPKLVFKSLMAGAGLLFASQRFKELCERGGLEGLRFDADLMDPF